MLVKYELCVFIMERGIVFNLVIFILLFEKKFVKYWMWCGELECEFWEGELYLKIMGIFIYFLS